jgi:hypothetical protein
MEYFRINPCTYYIDPRIIYRFYLLLYWMEDSKWLLMEKYEALSFFQFFLGVFSLNIISSLQS